jgi:hypothetical protein
MKYSLSWQFLYVCFLDCSAAYLTSDHGPHTFTILHSLALRRLISHRFTRVLYPISMSFFYTFKVCQLISAVESSMMKVYTLNLTIYP